MPSRKFELAKQENPELAEVLDRLMAYVELQSENGEKFFVPKLAAAALRLNDGEAYVLLEKLAKAGVLRRAFNVYCKRTGALLATVQTEHELNEIPHCDECDAHHDTSDLRVEIAFELSEQNDLTRQAA